MRRYCVEVGGEAELSAPVNYGGEKLNLAFFDYFTSVE